MTDLTRPRHAAAEHAHLRPELLRDVFELRDGLIRRVHRNDRGRGHPVAELPEIFRGHDIVGAHDRSPGGIIVDSRQAQAGGRVDDREIGAELVETLVEQTGHHRGGAIERVFRLPAPEGGLGDTPSPPLGDRHAQRVARGPHRGEEAVGGLVAANLSHAVAENGIEFDPVTVTVDDRVAQARADLCRCAMPVSAHMLSSPGATVSCHTSCYTWLRSGATGRQRTSRAAKPPPPASW